MDGLRVHRKARASLAGLRSRVIRNWKRTYAALVLLNGADFLFTWVALERGATEANPLMLWVLNHSGLPGIAMAKLIALAAIYFLMPHLQRASLWVQDAFLAALGAYGILMFYHVFLLFGPLNT